VHSVDNIKKLRTTKGVGPQTVPPKPGEDRIGDREEGEEPEEGQGAEHEEE